MLGVCTDKADGVGGTGEILEPAILDGLDVDTADAQELRHLTQVLAIYYTRSPQQRPHARATLLLAHFVLRRFRRGMTFAHQFTGIPRSIGIKQNLGNQKTAKISPTHGLVDSNKK